MAKRTAFRIPPVKGKKPGPIPASSVYVPPDSPEEEAAYATVGRSSGGSTRGRTRREQAEPLTAAQQRMAGKSIAFDEDDSDDRDEAEEREPQAYPDDDRENDVHHETLHHEPRAAPQWGANEPTLADLKSFVQEARQISGAFTPTTSASPNALGGGEVRAQSSQSLSARLVGLNDTDRLWDWIRQDTDRGASFLGKPIEHSLALHQIITALTQGEARGLSMLRALSYTQEHIGFVLLAPILAREQTALCSFYLRPDIRGAVERIMRPMLEIAVQLAPSMHLAICSSDGWVKFHQQTLGPLGFVQHVMFIR